MKMDYSNSEAPAVDHQELAILFPEDTKSWWLKPHLIKLNLMLGSVMLFAGTVGYDNSMMNGLQSLSQWQEFMDHPVGAWLGFINAIQAIGTCVGLSIMAIVANKYGRKRSIYVGLMVICLGVGLQAGAKNQAMFVVARFFVGSASGLFIAAPLLITETAYPSHRGKLTALYNCMYYIGSLIAAWATFGTRDYDNDWAWRIPSLLQIAIPTLAIIGTIFCPESPRWLISMDQVEEARAILIRYHAGGDMNSQLVALEMREVEFALRIERETSQKTSYLDMFKTKGNRHRLFISVTVGVFAQWNGVGVVSYYLSSVLATVGITSVTKQTLINGFLQLWNLLIAISGASTVDRLGRRFLFLTSTIGMLLCYIIITGLSGSFATTHHSSTGLAVIPMLFLYYGFYDIAFTPLVISYPAEIWPYQLRSRGVAVAQGSSFLALFFNLLVNPIALDGIGWRYYFVYVGILVGIGVVVAFWYPETRGRSLEEMKVVFDGERVGVEGDGLGEKDLCNENNENNVV